MSPRIHDVPIAGLAGALMLSLAAGSVSARPDFTGFPITGAAGEFVPRGMSGDGNQLVGGMNGKPARWTPGNGAVALAGAFASGTALEASGNGNWIVGTAVQTGTGGLVRAFVWVGGSPLFLGAGLSGPTIMEAVNFGEGSSTVAGYSENATATMAWLWRQSWGVAILPNPQQLRLKTASIDGAGAIIIGNVNAGMHLEQPWIWMAVPAVQFLPTTPEPYESVAEISRDGTTIVGRGFDIADPGLTQTEVNSKAYKWVNGGAPVLIGGLAGYPESAAQAVDADGSTIAGLSAQSVGGLTGAAAWVWTQDTGYRDVRQVLLSEGIAVVSGWTLETVTDISDDGAVLLGTGRTPGGQPAMWLADVTPGCYPDCTGEGALSLSDFGCFQSKYVLGDLYADCNASGTLTIADFGCYQGKYVLGCP